MTTLHVSAFGKFTLHLDGQPLPGFEKSKVQELLGYLLLFSDQPHTRDKLSALLWSDVDNGRKNLRKTLWYLQNDLTKVPEIKPFLTLCVDAEWIELVSSPQLKLDAQLLESSFQRLRGVPGEQLEADDVNQLEKAVELYHGMLLETCYSDWCLLEQQRFQHLYLASLHKIMRYCEVRGLFDGGIHYGQQALRIDSALERIHRGLMRLYYLQGDRSLALRQYARCVEALRDELGVEPTLRTHKLAENIRRNAGSLQVPEPTVPFGEGVEQPYLLEQLQKAQLLLITIQQELQRKPFVEPGRAVDTGKQIRG